MKTLSLLAMSLLFCFVFPARSDGVIAKGKEIFLKSNCASCHTVMALDIGKTEADSDQVAVEEGDIVPPDLSVVGLTYKADWIEKFLLKQEKIDGRKHKKRFTGSKEDLKTLSAWLESLQHEPEK
jgi:mono/diheme cytochrome c family protein